MRFQNLQVQSNEQEMIVLLDPPIPAVIEVTADSCPMKRCSTTSFDLSNEISRSLKIGKTAMVPSSPPENRSEPSSLILRQDTGLLL